MREGVRVGDRYRLEGRAGAGGMGVVFRAIDEQTGATVAVKVLSYLAGVSVERFRRETELLASLSHPGVVRYLGHGATTSGAPYLVMEWLEGSDLGWVLDQRKLELDETLRLGARIADAMGYLHAQEIVHRDLKPANVFLVDGDVGAPRLLDLGIARLEGMQRLTRTGGLVGTPGYMAPEQARSGAVTPATDVFALGAILFECLTGRLPFEGDHALAILTKVLLAAPPRLRDLVPDAPLQVDALLDRLLAREPEDRPANGHAVRSLIDAVVRREEDRTVVDSSTDSSTFPALAVRASVTPRERTLVTLLVARNEIDTLEGDATLVDDEPMPSGAQRLPGGGLVWLFTGSHSAADAARTALDAHRTSPSYRFAVAAGYMLVSGAVPLGAVTDRAVALLVRPSPGAIRVDEMTARALPDRFEVIEEDGVHVLLGVRDAPLGALRRARVPCIGREPELAIVRGIASKSFHERRAESLLIRAEAGTGKSRVLSEALDVIGREHGDVRVLFADCDAQHMGAPFACIRSALDRSGAIGRSEVELDRFATVHLPREERARSVAFLAETLRIPLARPSREVAAARLDPKLYVEQVYRAVVSALRALVSLRPLALVLEDVHACDAPSFKLVETALRALRTEPLLVLATARPEVDDVFPGVFKALGAQVIRLGPLPPRASVRLAKALNADLDPKRLEWLVDRAQGNALFIEELSRATPGEGDAALSLHAILAARLGQLPSELRRLMRAASVFGERAPMLGVEALLGGGGDPTSLVRQLESEDLLFLVESPEMEVVFRHALLRDAAYASLPDDDRVAAHLAAARWLEERAFVDPARVAEHFVRGGDRARAVPALLAAAKVAIEAHDAKGALATLQRAREQGASGIELGRLAGAEATARMLEGDMAGSYACGVDAMEKLPPGSGPWVLAAATASVVSLRLGLAAQAGTISERALDVTPRAGDAPAHTLATLAMNSLVIGREDLASKLMALIGDDSALDDLARFMISGYFGSLATTRGDFSAAVREFVVGEGVAEAMGDDRRLSAVLTNVGYALARAGRFAESETKLRRCIEVAIQLGATGHRTYALGNLAIVLRGQGRLDDARAAAEESMNAAIADGERHAEVAARTYLAAIWRDLGELTLAIEHARAAEILAEEAAPMRRATALGVLATTLARSGALVEARAIVERIAAAVANGSVHVGDVVDLRIAMAETLAKCGETALAREEAERAHHAIAAQADLMPPGRERESFLAIPEHRLARSLWEELG